MGSASRDRQADPDDAELSAARREAAELRVMLDAAVADGQRAEARASALTKLARELSAAGGTAAVVELLAAALPEILACDASAVWLWDPQLGEVRAAATAGLTAELHDALLAVPVRPAETPELAALLATRDPLVLNAGSVTPVLESMLAALGLRAAIGVALLSGSTLLGAVTGSWTEKPLEGAALREAIARLQGVADHAATALQNARLVERARHQALHDALTGLANRVLFQDRLDKALKAARRGAGAAVLFCDLDEFKRVNDDHGHRVGDEVLRQVALRLRDAVRPGDTVARLGGDEFAVLLPDVDDSRSAHEVAERVTSCFAEPLRIGGRHLRLSISVGVATHVGGEGHAGPLLQAADTAMYAAKRRGRNQIADARSADAGGTITHSTVTHSTVTHSTGAQGTGTVGGPPGRLGGQPAPSLPAELRTAADAGELRLLLQPLVALDRSGPTEVVGAEALVRWQHPRLGLLAPAAFLPLAEQDGSVVRLDRWMLREACRAAASWPDAARPAHVAVNVSVRTLGDPGLVEVVRTALLDVGLSPTRLALEVVESRALLDLPGVAERLAAVRHLGVRVSLDDFGTGFSTLSWLQELPVDRIKVDRSIVHDTTTPDPRRRRAAHALLRGMLAIGRELGIEVLAEGVETPEQLEAVRRTGCRLGQGYLLGRPGAPEQLQDLLAAQGQSDPGPRRRRP